MKYFENMTRGQLNCNPLNIRRGSKWQGLAPVQTDKSFCQFTSSVWGIRAALVVLRTYAYKHKLHTIHEVISRFAPSADGNNVNNYCYLIQKNCNAMLPFDNYYYNPSVNEPMNIWWSMKEPKLCVFYLLRAMCVVESYYTLTFGEYQQAVKLL